MKIRRLLWRISDDLCLWIPYSLTGKGTHGSAPELGIDPINAGVHLYLALQELIAREISAMEEAVLTIGRFESGSAFNVIPHRAVLEGSLRTFKIRSQRLYNLPDQKKLQKE